MASNVQIPSDQSWYFAGSLGAKSFTCPAGAIGDTEIKAAAKIDATKLMHQHALRYTQKGGSDVAAETVPLHIFRGAATIVAVEVVPLTAPTGGDKAFTVDVKKGNQSTGFASILSAVVTIDNTKADRQVVPGTVSTTSAADDDTLEVVIATSGTTGSQGQGVIVVVTVREEP